MGHRLIKSVRINLGGDTIDEHNGRWFEIWNQLTHDDSMKKAYDEMVGYHGVPGWSSDNTQVDGAQTLYIPLQFWFNRNPGLSLPLIALQYHEVKVIFNFEDVNKLVVWPYVPTDACWNKNALSSMEQGGPYNGTALGSSGDDQLSSVGVANDATRGPDLGLAWKGLFPSTSSEFTANLYVDYIYLDTEERKRFAQMSHEYLIDQLQIHGKETLTNFSHRMRLNFNHPVKELIWVFEPPEAGVISYGYTGAASAFNFEGGDTRSGFYNGVTDIHANKVKYRWGNFAESSGDTTPTIILDWLKDAKLQINGHDRFSTRPGSYFRRVQPYQFHGGVPDVPIYVYSFALRPEEFQPSGTCNFSRIDNAYLELNLKKFLTPVRYVHTTAVATNGLLPYYAIETPGTDAIQNVTMSTDGALDQPTWQPDNKLNLYAYAVSYNVLKIVSGRGGLAYSN